MVCIVREPISFFTSRCQQFISERYFDKASVKSFIEGEKIENGEVRSDCHAMNPAYFLSENIKKYEHFFGDVVVIDFESAANAYQSFTHYFLKSVGVEGEINDIRLNESRSDKAIDVISYINYNMPFNVASGYWKIRKYGDMKVFYSYSLPDDLKLKISKKIKNEVNWLCDNYGIDYRLMPVREISSKIFWGDVFYQQSITIFPALPLHLKIFFKSFVVDRIKSEVNSRDDGLLKTEFWIKNKYPLVYVCDNEFGFLLSRVFSRLQWLIGKIKKVLRLLIGR